MFARLLRGSAYSQPRCRRLLPALSPSPPEGAGLKRLETIAEMDRQGSHVGNFLPGAEISGFAREPSHLVISSVDEGSIRRDREIIEREKIGNSAIAEEKDNENNDRIRLSPNVNQAITDIKLWF